MFSYISEALSKLHGRNHTSNHINSNLKVSNIIIAAGTECTWTKT